LEGQSNKRIKKEVTTLNNMEKKTEKIYPEGFNWKDKALTAPSFVVGGIGINKNKFIKWLESQEGDWVNLKVNEKYQSKEIEVTLDTWKPTYKKEETPKVDTGEIDPLSIPF
jgi:hypothetical protein